MIPTDQFVINSSESVYSDEFLTISAIRITLFSCSESLSFSLGCVMFLAFLVFVICFMIKKKCKKNSNKSEIVRVDEHYKMNEAIVEGPHGPEAVVLSVEDDVHIEDLVKKGEKKWEKTV
ncbi:hypothetical protein Bca52824_080291 [Brassica carinata]|uniref:Uncharacterized protein n=1 Tax=Brassica carinata TaxID=52824 RepID=A0A8X7TPX6_BRACI|nr:hypothetical protein Bca52824_080291 [Brassica carinata]